MTLGDAMVGISDIFVTWQVLKIVYFRDRHMMVEISFSGLIILAG